MHAIHCADAAVRGVGAQSKAQLEVSLKKYLLFMLGLFLLGTDAWAGEHVPVEKGLSIGVMQRLERSRWIASGAKSAGRVVYVFTDPNCPFCNDLWKALKSARAPDVQVRYLLVAVIDEDSRAKDAAILESKDPAASLEEHERAYASGGIAPKASSQPATRETIAVNEDLMRALHIYGTPGLVYLDERGEVAVFAGMPDPGQLRMIVGKRDESRSGM